MLECKQELQLAAQIYIYFVNNSVELTDSCSGWIQKAMSPQSDAPLPKCLISLPEVEAYEHADGPADVRRP